MAERAGRPERPTITHTGALPPVAGLSLGPGGAGPHGLFAPDGGLVALAEPTGQGWWWLTVGAEAAMARITPPEAVLVGTAGEEVARCDLTSVAHPGGRCAVAVSSPDPWRVRVWDQGTTVLRLERTDDVVVVRPDPRLDPTVAVFVAVALVRASLPVAAPRPGLPGEVPALAVDALAALLTWA